MFSQEMIKSSFEPPKRSLRSANNNHSISSSNEIEVFNVNYENFGSFGKKIVEPSSALIPPWIKNSLGLSEESGLFGSHTESNSTKFLFKCDENKSSNFSSNQLFEKDVTSVNTEQAVPFVEVNIRQVTGFIESPTDDVAEETSCMVLHKHNMKELENSNSLLRDKKNKSGKSEVTSIDVVMALDGNMLQQKSTDDEKRKNKNHRQRVKTKKRSYDEHKSDDVTRSDLDVMLEKKAREMLEKYLKKDIHNSVENKSEGKFVVLNGKIKPESVKLAEEDLLLLQEIKEQVGSKENIEKILENIKANELKSKKKDEVKHVCEKHRNKLKDNSEKNKTCQNQPMKNEDMIKETLLSTDDENEIKKFSEFLSKNKNSEEKRRCLEEVRNYFEKKRCSRIERQVKKSDKVQKTIPSTPEKKEIDGTTNEVEKKSSSEQSDEVVEKAVSETLQKFTELYRFEIPQNVIKDMKKSIIKTIKSENIGQSPNRKNLDGISLIFELKDGVDNVKSSSLSVVDNQNNKICVVADENNKTKELKCSKKNPFKTIIDPKTEKPQKIEDSESGSIKELMKDFEQCLESIQAQVDIAGTKLCSVVFEKTDSENITKKAKLVYNFKKADSLRISYEKNSDGDAKPNKNNENSKKSAKTQTVEDFLNDKKESTDKTVQTKEKKTIKMSTQTEWKVNETGPKVVRTPEGDHAHDKSLSKQNESELLSNILDSKNQPVSKEFSQSDKGILTKDKKTKKLERSIKSDCLGVNKQPHRQSEQKKKANVTAVNYLFLKQDQPNTEPNLRQETGQTKALMDGDAVVNIKDEVKTIENHPGCVWLWNGKKIDPGCDLKIQVEELMKEKIKEMIDCNKVAREAEGGYRNDYDCKTGLGMTSTESFTTSADSSERNLEIRKIDGKFCFSKSSNSSMTETPFVFTAESRDLGEDQKEKQPPDKIWDKAEESIANNADEKQFREIGTQNSQQNFLSKLNLSRLTTRSKGKISRHKFKNTISSNSLITQQKPIAVAKKVSETKKVKLEVEKENTFIVDEGSNQSLSNNSNQGCDSLLSNSTYSAESEEITPAISLQNEEKNQCPKYNIKENETNENQDAEKEKTNLKQWEFIESVLNRVNQKEKENLWDDIRDFLKTKIGRDINDEGAREVCIEIEQDLPKQRKGKTNQAIVAKGNYTRNEGDIEVEVDLTLDDLERILRHRQKKLRRRQTYTKGFESKQSTSSAAIPSMEEIQKYQTFLNSCKALGGDYITESELKIIKDSENGWNPRN